MKIANKISISFFIAGLILTCAAESVFYIVSQSALRKSIENNLETAVDASAHHIETYLKALKSSVTSTSKSVVLPALLKTSKGDSKYREVFETAVKLLHQKKKFDTSIYEYLIIDKSGKVVASTDETSIGEDKSNDPIFTEAKKEPHIKDVYYSDKSRMALIAVSAPFLDSESGAFLGILAARVRLDELNGIVERTAGMGESGEIYIVNQHRYMVTPSQFVKDVVLKQKVGTENAREAFLHKGKEHVISEHEMPEVFLDYRGVRVLGKHAYIPEMQWGVLAEIDAREALQPLKVLGLVFILTLLCVSVVVWMLGNRIAEAISAPIHRLRFGTEIIGNGNLDYKVGTDADDEVGQLSRAFDSMTENLKKTTTSVERLNKEIVERRQAEETLRNQTAILAAITSSAQDAIVMMDQDGNISFWNHAAERLFGWSREEAMGKNLHSLITPERFRDAHKNAFSHFQMTGEGAAVGKTLELAGIRKDGTEFPLDLSLSSVQLSGKWHAVGIIRDVTERKEQETKIKQRVEELVVQLLQAEKMTTLGEMSAGITHELNQPLNVTKIICQGILRDVQKGRFSEEDAKRDLPEVVNQMNKLSEIIDHMRIFSRQSVGNERLKHNLNDVIINTLKFISQQFRDHNVQLVMTLAPELPSVMIDQIQIEQVLMNLLGNARYATENSGRDEKRVEIKTFAKLDEKKVVLEVVDNGMGIPEEVKVKIFKAFFTTKEAGKGTGLGLSVSKKIIEEHKGEIVFESEAGIGTTFRMTLPAIEAESGT